MAVPAPPSPDVHTALSGSHARTGSSVLRGWLFLTAGKQREVRSVHNGELPVARLPGEVLAEVFTWYILDVCTATEDHAYASVHGTRRESVDLPRYRPAPYSWLYIRHVCRAWRRIALTYQELSTHICLSIPACVQELLSRSGMLPLHVYDPSPHYMDSHERRVLKCCELVLPHMRRISRGTLLALNGAIDIMPLDVDDDANPATPLDITALLKPPTQSRSIRPLLRLQNLCLGQVDPTPIPPGLRALHLRRLKLVRHSFWDPLPEDFIEDLRPFQNLEELTLGEVIGGDSPSWHHFPFRDTPVVHGERSITLRNLRIIHLTTHSAGAGLYFLTRIDHPPSTTLDLTFTDLKPPMHYDCHCIESMICWKIRALTCDETTPIQSLHLSVCHDRRGLDLRLWKDYQPLSALRKPSRAPQPSFRFSLKACGNTAPAFTSLFRRLALRSVRSAVLVDRAAGQDAVGWQALLSELRGLEELALDYQVIVPSSGQPRDIGSRDTQALCPALRTLAVRETAGTRAWESAMAELRPPATLAHVSRDLVARGVPGVGVQAGEDAVDDVRELDFCDSDAESFAGVCVEGPSQHVYTSQQLPEASASAAQPTQWSTLGRFMSIRGRS